MTEEREDLKGFSRHYQWLARQDPFDRSIWETSGKREAEMDNAYSNLVEFTARTLLEKRGEGASDLLEKVTPRYWYPGGHADQNGILRFYADVAGKIAEIGSQPRPEFSE